MVLIGLYSYTIFLSLCGELFELVYWGYIYLEALLFLSIRSHVISRHAMLVLLESIVNDVSHVERSQPLVLLDQNFSISRYNENLKKITQITEWIAERKKLIYS